MTYIRFKVIPKNNVKNAFEELFKEPEAEEKKFLEHVQTGGGEVKAVRQKSKVELLFFHCGFPLKEVSVVKHNLM